jgi:hypothetical protein
LPWAAVKAPTRSQARLVKALVLCQEDWNHRISARAGGAEKRTRQAINMTRRMAISLFDKLTLSIPPGRSLQQLSTTPDGDTIGGRINEYRMNGASQNL